MKYIISIGLETHVQLKTKSKMFCGCSTEFASPPNTNICPLCLGYPGTLPLLNREAVRLAAMAGLMLECDIKLYSKFDRKNYFYPDVGKNYQVSQLDKPICLGGKVSIPIAGGGTKIIRITRIHLEEDVAKSTHHPKCSGVDFNRSGMPLMEIVSEPDLSSADETASYLTTLIQILKYAEVSDCNLEEGSIRCDVNVSIRPEGTDKLGTKVEIKNMNSISNIHDALLYEVERQKSVIGSGGAIMQETRRWDPDMGETIAMRSKENAHDYRYFPEPDILPIVLTAQQVEEWKALLPELPEHKRVRFVEQYGIPEYDAKVLCAQLPIAGFFEDTVKLGVQAKQVSNWIMTDLLRMLGQNGQELQATKITAQSFASLLKLVEQKVINMPVAKELFVELVEKGGSPDKMVKERGLGQVSDGGAIEGFARQVVGENPKVVEDFLGGKQPALQFLVGQVMKLSKGKANPVMAGDAIKKIIGER